MVSNDSLSRISDDLHFNNLFHGRCRQYVDSPSSHILNPHGDGHREKPLKWLTRCEASTPYGYEVIRTVSIYQRLIISLTV